jgi:hypothetical protein
MASLLPLRPGKGAGPKHGDENSEIQSPAPLPGCNASALDSRWFHHRLISLALSGQKQKSPNEKNLGNGNVENLSYLFRGVIHAACGALKQ